MALKDKDLQAWHVMRCHSAALGKVRTQLEAMGARFFVPETMQIVTEKGKKVKRLRPVVKDIIFIYDSFNSLKAQSGTTLPIYFYFSRTSHIQDDALWVTEREMDNFISVCQSYDRKPEIRPFGEIDFKKGQKIRIISGPLEGTEGYLAQIKRGQRKKLVITLSNLITIDATFTDEDLFEIIED